MTKKILIPGSILFIYAIAVLLSGCSKDKWDIIDQGIPKFVASNYIELNTILQISKFRSGIGHDYSDSFEQCRSMKHYFQPKTEVDWSSIKIYSPVSGTIIEAYNEWAGTQVIIVSDDYPAFEFIIFHMKLSSQFKVGDKVKSGDQIGTHIGTQTMSDIAVKVRETSKKIRFISYFDVMTNNLFNEYVNRGIVARENVIISKTERDADPLSCNGETFNSAGALGNWVFLY
jgi:hypothetical protein